MRYVKVTKEEAERLSALHKDSPEKLVRKRSHCLLLSSKGFKISELSDIFEVSRRTIERWFDGWEKEGTESLSMKKGRGAKKLLAGHEEIIKTLVKEHNRNLKPVLEYIHQQLNLRICKRTLKNFLKCTGV